MQQQFSTLFGPRQAKKCTHYEITLIQIYWTLHNQKKEHFQQKKIDIVHSSAQIIDCGYSLELTSTTIYVFEQK